jgi:ABC-type nitrate/sulfonate/bicarbonate transport system permease component
MFRGIIVISLMGSLWFAALAITERYVIYWQDHGAQGRT